MSNFIKAALDHTHRNITLNDSLRRRIVSGMRGQSKKPRFQMCGAIPVAACILTTVLLLFALPLFLDTNAPGPRPGVAETKAAATVCPPEHSEKAQIPLPTDSGIELYSLPIENQITIKVFPKYLPFAKYYLPDSATQKQILSYMDDMLKSEKSTMDYDVAYSGVSIVYKNDVWQLATNHSLYTTYSIDKDGMISERKEPVQISGQKALCVYIWQLVNEKFGTFQMDVADIHDIVRAELSFFSEHGDEGYGGKSSKCIGQSVTDPAKLKLLEKCLSHAMPSYSDSTNCPFCFPTAILALEKSNGDVIWLHLIQDGCAQFFHEGTLYIYENKNSVYSSPGEDILRIFDGIPFYCNQ